MRTIILIALIQIFNVSLQAQGKEDYTWVIGFKGDSLSPHYGGMTMNFKTSTPVIKTFSSFYDHAYSSSISDESGNLLLYSNGCCVYDKNHQIINNGCDLNAGGLENYACGYDSLDYYRGEVSLILPWPGRDGVYKIIHTITKNLTLTDLSVVHSTIVIENGEAAITEKQVPWINNDTIHPGVIHLVKHANGRDWWLMTNRLHDNKYYFSLFDSSGISAPILKEVNGAYKFTGGSQFQSSFSPDGHYFAQFDAYKAQIFEVDRCRGMLYNPQVLYNDSTYIFSSSSFSDDSRFLYVSQNNKLYQYDLKETNFAQNKVLVGAYDGYRDEVTQFQTTFGYMHLAPDRKIYMSSAQGINLHVIHHPEKKGTACQFIQHQFKLPKLCSNALGNLPHYRTPTQVPACDQLVYDSSYCNCRDTLPIARKLSIYPNPALEYVEVSGPPGTEVPLSVEIYDALGRLLIQQHFTCLPGRVSLSGLPAAGYFYRIVGADGKAVQESTLVKVNR